MFGKISPLLLDEQTLRRGSRTIIRRTLRAVVGAGRASDLDLSAPDVKALVAGPSLSARAKEEPDKMGVLGGCKCARESLPL